MCVLHLFTALHAKLSRACASVYAYARVRGPTCQHLFASSSLYGGLVLAGIGNSLGVGIVRRRALFPFSIFEGLLKSAYFFGLFCNGVD